MRCLMLRGSEALLVRTCAVAYVSWLTRNKERRTREVFVSSFIFIVLKTLTRWPGMLFR